MLLLLRLNLISLRRGSTLLILGLRHLAYVGDLPGRYLLTLVLLLARRAAFWFQPYQFARLFAAGLATFLARILILFKLADTRLRDGVLWLAVVRHLYQRHLFVMEALNVLSSRLLCLFQVNGHAAANVLRAGDLPPIIDIYALAYIGFWRSLRLLGDSLPAGHHSDLWLGRDLVGLRLRHGHVLGDGVWLD